MRKKLSIETISKSLSYDLRVKVYGELRDRGFQPDEINKVTARIALGDSMTAIEDQLEYASIDSKTNKKERQIERQTLKDIRRKLETELFR